MMDNKHSITITFGDKMGSGMDVDIHCTGEEAIIGVVALIKGLKPVLPEGVDVLELVQAYAKQDGMIIHDEVLQWPAS